MFVAGRQVVRDARVVHIDEVWLYREVRAAAERIAGRLDMTKMLKLRRPVEQARTRQPRRSETHDPW